MAVLDMAVLDMVMLPRVPRRNHPRRERKAIHSSKSYVVDTFTNNRSKLVSVAREFASRYTSFSFLEHLDNTFRAAAAWMLVLLLFTSYPAVLLFRTRYVSRKQSFDKRESMQQY